jgi:hypothetical protein
VLSESDSVITLIFPVPLIVEVKTGSPIFFALGILSPVSVDSSISENPSMTDPSTGIFSPGFIITRSPMTRSSTGTIFMSVPLMMVAVLGAMSSNDLIESVARRLDLDSKYRPKRTIPIIAHEVPKYVSGNASFIPKNLPRIAKVLYR